MTASSGRAVWLLAIPLAGCAATTAAPPGAPLADAWSRLDADRAERLELQEGWLASLHGVQTSTEGFSTDPLEPVWWPAEGPIEPVLSRTATVSFDLPWSEHPSVEEWVSLLEGRGQKWFRLWLARSTRYVPLFYEVLDRHGLPRDLVFLSMVESGFSPWAFSWASAAGPWQFMPRTARRYGLRVGFWVDERRDFERSTEAAAKHLLWLHEVFGDWHLAMAAYNAGAGRVRGAIRQHGKIEEGGSVSFWDLQGTSKLRRETRNYVPKILAAAKISKAPERHGFGGIPYLPPVRWETVTVTVATSLAAVGEACGGLPAQALEELNPALRVGVTPPGEVWPVRVPPGLAAACVDGLAGLPANTRLSFRYHELRAGESLEAVAARYRTSADAIRRFHQGKEPEALLELAELAVPVPYLAAADLPVVAPEEDVPRAGRYGPGESRTVVYQVRSGDSLWKIGQRFGVSMAQIRTWNGLDSSPLQIDQRLRIRVGATTPARPPPAPRGPSHQVAEGESLWVIARRYDTTVEHLQRLNRLRPGEILSVGRRLRVR